MMIIVTVLSNELGRTAHVCLFARGLHYLEGDATAVNCCYLFGVGAVC